MSSSDPAARGSIRQGPPWSSPELLTWISALLGGLWMRGPSMRGSGFASHDVAGILYNGMLLRRGLLPYVDSYELKPPGTFYAAALLAGPDATDIAAFQWWAAITALATALVVGLTARRLAGPIAGAAALGCYLLVSIDLDSMDANYVTWANLPHALGGYLGVCALQLWSMAERKSSASARGLSWRAVFCRPQFVMFAAGMCAALATLCKLPQGIVLVALLLGPWLARSEGRGASSPAALLVSCLLGFVAMHLPLALHYLGHGQLMGLATSYPINRWGLEYLRERGPVGIATAREAFAATAYFVALPLALAIASWAGRLGRGVRGASHPKAAEGGVPESAHNDALWRWTWIWFVLTWGTTLLGQRFYKGYFLAPLVPLSVLAGVGVDQLWRGLWGTGPRLAQSATATATASATRRDASNDRPRKYWGTAALHMAMILIAAGLSVRQVGLDLLVHHDRSRVLDEGGKTLAEVVKARTDPEDRIWVWGWHLWDVYAYSNRLSASPIYKALGVLTPPNDDTWRTPASPLHFVDGAGARQLMADLDRVRPRMILLGGTVPRDEFVELRSFLRAHYRRLASPRVGRVEIWERRDADGDAAHSRDPAGP